MTKADLIDAVAYRLKLPHPRAELLVDLVFSSMSDALMRGEGIELRGFGSLPWRVRRLQRPQLAHGCGGEGEAQAFAAFQGGHGATREGRSGAGGGRASMSDRA